MIPSLGVQRPLIVQDFRTFAVAVTAAALPIQATLDKTRLITSFVISNPTTGVSVFIGQDGVTTATGLEIPAGTAPQFTIDQQGRQLYEIQQQLNIISGGLQCKPVPLEGLPFVVWDLSRLFIVAGGNTTVSLMVFPTMYL